MYEKLTSRAESDLRHFQTLFDITPNLLCILNDDASFRMVNPAWTNIMGHQPKELLGFSMLEFLHPTDKASTLDELSKVRVAGGSHKFENRFRQKCGEYRWLAWHTNFVDGSIYCIVREITVEKSAAINADRYGKLMEALLDNIPSGVAACDDNGIIFYRNKTLIEYHGAPKTDISPDRWSENYALFKSDGITPLESNDVPLWQALKGEHVKDAEVVIAPEGKPKRHLLCNAHPLVDSNNHQLGAVVSMQDVTELKRIEQERAGRIERERLFDVFMEAPAPISIVRGDDFVVEFANNSYRKLVGEEREVIGKPMREAYPDLQEAIFDILNSVYKTGERYIGREFPIDLDWKSDGVISKKHFNFVFEPTRSLEGKVNGVVTFAFEVTEQVLARIELQKAHDELEMRVKDRTLALSAANKELEAFSYSVSHDLRSPLRGIDGFAQALIEDYYNTIDSSGRQYLSFIREGTQKMGQLIDDLLALSRLSRSELTRVESDLGAIARDVANELERANPGRKIKFIIRPIIKSNCDPGLIRIIFQNLMGNAVKFTSRSSEPCIEVGAQPHGEKSAIFVRDNGVGFDMAYSGKLFGAFQRLHSPQEGFSGTGIGLATVRRIVHRHGGTVWGESQINKGATFYFTLS